MHCQGGMDYSVAPTSFNLTVGPLNLGPRLLSVTIPILEDDILEQNENFEVRLDTTLPDRVNFGIQTAEIIILDNEGSKLDTMWICYFKLLLLLEM